MAIDYELTSLQTKKTQQNCNLQKNTYPITAEYLHTPPGTHLPTTGTGRKQSYSVSISKWTSSDCVG